MEKDKLENAAESAMEGLGYFTQVNAASIKTAFIQGAEWLIGQPLRERMTEEEKEKIKERYDYYMSEEPNCYLGSRMRNEYESIFGKEMFENNNN